MLFLQSPLKFLNTLREVDYFMSYGNFNIDPLQIEEVLNNRTVELIAFVLMPNHFHLIVQELEEKGISEYLRRIQDGFARYFNIKYERSGYLFQQSYNAVRLSNNDQMLYCSTYLHRNPRELSEWKDKEHSYPWSSYPDYISSNRWRGLLKPDIVLGQFESPAEYKSFTGRSIAKEVKILPEEIINL